MTVDQPWTKRQHDAAFNAGVETAIGIVLTAAEKLEAGNRRAGLPPGVIATELRRAAGEIEKAKR